MKLISFVIPTYNFANFIGETLNSILNEDSKHYEIIVFDGYSTDHTPGVMHNYQKKFKCIKYIRSSKRNNIDVDLNLAIKEATGDYIWTLSSDDVLKEGWLEIILKELNAYPSDIYLIPAVHCSLDMKPQRQYPILKNQTAEITHYKLESFNDFTAYLKNVRTSEGLFSFCSSCLIKRSKIMETDLLTDANGTCWRYAARMIQALLTFPVKISIFGVYVLYKRGENDSFGSGGAVKRMEIAISKWSTAVTSLNLPLKIAKEILNLVHSDIKFLSLLYVGQCVSSLEERNIFEVCVRQRYSKCNIRHNLSRFILLKTPNFEFLKVILIFGKKCLVYIRAKKYVFKN